VLLRCPGPAARRLGFLCPPPSPEGGGPGLGPPSELTAEAPDEPDEDERESETLLTNGPNSGIAAASAAPRSQSNKHRAVAGAGAGSSPVDAGQIIRADSGAEASTVRTDAGPCTRGADDGASTPNGSGDSSRAPPAWRLLSRALPVAGAYLVLAITTGIGVTMATYFQRSAGLNSFGYTAVDQVLLPFTTLPLAAALDASVRLRGLVGEPVWSAAAAKPPNFAHTLRRAWAEVNAGSPHSFWLTLVPFHGLEMLRSLLFFYLVTQFDVDSTYMTMTLLRVVLCWLASLLVCTVLRAFVGLDAAEARAAVHPVNLAVKVAGSSLLVVSIVLQKGAA
jgi:hypothetical protein